MKSDSILVVTGHERALKEEDLAEELEQNRFRGVAIDTPFVWKGESKKAPWEYPNVLMTPLIAPLPEITVRGEFQLFLYNFRRFVHSDFDGLKNILE